MGCDRSRGCTGRHCRWSLRSRPFALPASASFRVILRPSHTGRQPHCHFSSEKRKAQETKHLTQGHAATTRRHWSTLAWGSGGLCHVSRRFAEDGGSAVFLFVNTGTGAFPSQAARSDVSNCYPLNQTVPFRFCCLPPVLHLTRRSPGARSHAFVSEDAAAPWQPHAGNPRPGAERRLGRRRPWLLCTNACGGTPAAPPSRS